MDIKLFNEYYTVKDDTNYFMGIKQTCLYLSSHVRKKLLFSFSKGFSQHVFIVVLGTACKILHDASQFW